MWKWNIKVQLVKLVVWKMKYEGAVWKAGGGKNEIWRCSLKSWRWEKWNMKVQFEKPIVAKVRPKVAVCKAGSGNNKM